MARPGERMQSSMAPSRVIIMALFLAFGLSVAAVWTALRQPWLGLELGVAARVGQTSAPARIVVGGVSPGGPAAALPAGVWLSAIAAAPSGAAPGPFIHLVPEDLIEDPDFFDSYADMRRLFARQSQIADVLSGPVLLRWSGPDGTRGETRVKPAPWRPMRTLPVMFWFQIAVGVLAWLLGAWVWALRPRDWAARMLAAAGLLLLVTTAAAAVYSTRELALPGEAFRALSALNHLGAISFGMAMVGLFMMYPRPLANPAALLVLPLVFLPWWGLDTWQFAPSQNWGGRLPILIEMLLAISLAVVQWHRARRHPADRAALRWFNMSALFGSLLFVVVTAGSNLLAVFPPISQGYAFGFFLVVFGGLAFGIGRYRLFDLDRWAYRLLLWALGVVAVVALDLMLALAVGFNPGPSLVVTLLICGALYFPVRQWLWGRMVQKPPAPMHVVLPQVVEVAFTPGALAREQRWLNLLQNLFNPLQSKPQEGGEGKEVALGAEGLELQVPSTGGMAARRLVGRNGGLKLFSPQDVAFVRSLCNLLDQAAGGRDAFVQGVEQERRRIAQDLHDELGAKLLTALHSTGDARLRTLLEDAIAQMRMVVRGLAQPELPQADFLADLRHDTAQRLAVAGIALDWPIAGQDTEEDGAAWQGMHLDALQQYQLRGLLHEAITNAIRHAGAKRVQVRLKREGVHLRLQIGDDGRGFDPLRAPEGQGLRSMRTRAQALGGEVHWHSRGARPDAAEGVVSGAPGEQTPGGTQVEINWPAQPASAAPAARLVRDGW
ncbi:sensor histidine kinase LiaS [mine drainage metagenome]|uniref:histidine kinase n=1 Tax=mine drainage metagenome TaxID=410659 RepID=A0A1J5RP22_9ZZZZ